MKWPGDYSLGAFESALKHIETRLGQLQDLEAEPKAIESKTIGIQEELERR